MIGITAGAFDLLHAGHVLMLKECKEQCGYLIVALQSDPSIDRPKKNKPVESMEERMIRLNGCRYVDRVLTYDTEADLYKLLKQIKPDLRFVGADWEGKRFTGDNLPIEVVFNSRNHDYSSTNLRKRIFENLRIDSGQEPLGQAS